MLFYKRWLTCKELFSQIWKWHVLDEVSQGVMFSCHQIKSLVRLQGVEGKEICYLKSIGHEKPGAKAYQVRAYFSIKRCSMWPSVITARVLCCWLFLCWIPSSNDFRTLLTAIFSLLLLKTGTCIAFSLCFVSAINHIISGAERHYWVACMLSVWG